MPITFRQERLPNGMTVLAEVDPAAHSAAVGFFVKTGARDESAKVMGVSHFLEHMMFKGTERLSAEDVNRAFDDMGARNNAYTGHEVTCFHAHVLPEKLSEATDLLAEMMRPALREDDFTTEKGVILEEIAMYKDNPLWVLYEACMERFYCGHPLGHRVLGTDESIAALQRDAMMAYFRERYSADNTTVALAGRLDFDALVARIAERCAGWQTTNPTRDAAKPPTAEGVFELRDPKINRAYVIGLAEAPAADDDRRYAAAMLSQVLGAGDNSRLHWALIEPGIAEEAQAGYDANEGCGAYHVFASGDPERADEIWSIAEREMAQLVDSLSDDDLVRLRNKVATAATVGGERPADRMQRLGRLWTSLGRYLSLDEEIDRMNRVTLDEMRSVAEAFPLRARFVGRLLPAE